MKADRLIAKLLKTGDAKTHRALFREHAGLLDLKLAEAIKNTYYDSWTKEPLKTRRAATALQVLNRIIPDENVTALSFWVRGIADLTEGKLEKATKDLDQAAALFDALHKPLEIAQTRVGKLYALALLGKYDEAVACGENALEIFVEFGDELAAGKIEMNLSNVAARRERHLEAEKYGLSARRRFAKIGETNWLTLAENSLANTYGELNDFRQAEKFYARALSRAQANEMLVTEAEIEASIGNLALFRGKLDRALHFLETSRRKYETLAMPHQTAIAELEIGSIYLELNLADEAFSIFERVSETLRQLKMPGEEATARANFGRAAILKNDLPTARKQLKKAARLYVAEKNRGGAANVKIAQAKLELERKNYRKVRELSDEITALTSDSGNVRQKLAARLIKAEAQRFSGDIESAKSELHGVFTDSIKNEQPNMAQAAQIALGVIAAARDDVPRAEKHFKRAIQLIETLRAPLAAEEFRMAFLADKLAPYEFLTKIYLSENKIEKAFAQSERARSRSLAESLGAYSAARNRQTSPVLQKKLADLREELNWFYNRLNRADESEVAALQTAARERERRIADVMRQIASTQARRHDFKESSASDWENLKNLQNTLGANKALIEFVNYDGVFSSFVVTDEKIEYVRDLSAESDVFALLEKLRFQFGALRYGAAALEKHFDELKKRADSHLRKLHEKLFAPLERFVGARDLVVVPTGATHYVPFHSLFDGARYLIETREIVHAPSATVWQHLASKPRAKSDRALLIGYADERIPLVNQEIETLGEIFPTAQSFTGERANVAAFTTNAARFDVLHLACHGQFRPENPLFSSLHLADGRLTVRDVVALDLRAELVALSACETGLNSIYAGEEILGLTRGFLSAGAKSLLLSLWTVNDAATSGLMKMFYEHRKTGVSAATSLRVAQRSFIERGVHPYFWSPFVLIGK